MNLLIFVAMNDTVGIGNLERTEDQAAQYPETDNKGQYQWRSFVSSGGANDFRSARPRLFYRIFVKNNHGRIPDMEWLADSKTWKLIKSPKKRGKCDHPVSGETEFTWRLGTETLKDRIDDLRVREGRGGKTMIEIKFRLDEDGVLPKTICMISFTMPPLMEPHYSAIFLESRSSFPSQNQCTQEWIVCVQRTFELNDSVLDDYAVCTIMGHAVISLNREDGG